MLLGILTTPLPFPNLAHTSRRSGPPLATNVGFEIEVGALRVEGRIGPRLIDADYFLLKAMIAEPDGYVGFSVQSDGGRIELVSDPPIPTRNPVSVVRSMASYVNDLERRLARGQRDPSPEALWRVARAVQADQNGLRVAQEHDGQQIEIRVYRDQGHQLDGTFHATVGLHLSAIPWLFACGRSQFPDVVQDFPVPGYVLRRQSDRKDVLERMEKLRNTAHDHPRWRLSPEFEGFAYLVFTYIASAQSPLVGNRPSRELSPKQLFYVLARTDFATLLRLTPEAQPESRRRVSFDVLKSAILVALPDGAASSPMFTDRFGDAALSIGEILGLVSRRKDLSAAFNAKRDDDRSYTTLAVTPRHWLDRLFSETESMDILTSDAQEHLQWHARHADQPFPTEAEIEPSLLRGMGALGDAMDLIPDRRGRRTLRAPLFELRRLTPGSLPGSDRWKEQAERVVTLVTALNAPASEDDVREAKRQLEWIRRTGLPRTLGGDRQTGAAALAQVDDICVEIHWQMETVEVRAQLWTLLDRARTLTDLGERVRDRRSDE